MPDYPSSISRKNWEKHGERPSVKDWGAKGDGIADDTQKIQDAINGVQSLMQSSGTGESILYGGGRILFIPPGRYRITSTITLKSCMIQGAFPLQAVELVWDGAPGGTMFTKDNAFLGGVSWGLIAGMRMVAGSTEPGTFLDFGAYVDSHFWMEDLAFRGSSGDAIKMRDGWINVVMRRIRWDRIGGYAINATVGYPVSLIGNQNGSAFLLQGFTYDNRITDAGGRGLGLLQVNNSVRNVSQAGVFRISNARIELNQALSASSNKGLVNLKLAASPAGSAFLGLHISDLYFQDVTGANDKFLVFRDTVDTLGNETVSLTNVRLEGAKPFGGTWPANWPNPYSTPFWTFHNLTIGSNRIDFLGTTQEHYARQVGDDLVRCRVGSEANPRLAVRAEGLAYGPGSAAVDGFLRRHAIGELRVDDILRFNKDGDGGVALSNDDTQPNVVRFNAVNFGNPNQGGYISVNSKYTGFPNWVKSSTHAYNNAMFIGLGASRFRISFGAATNAGGADPGTIMFYVEDGTGIVCAGQTRHDASVKLANLVGSRALALDSAQNIVASTTTALELDRLAGVTSPVQAQIDTKATKSTVGAHTITLAKLTPGGTNGSITWTADGVVSSYVDPT